MNGFRGSEHGGGRQDCKEQPKLVKVDIARAFRNVCVDPWDAVKLGIKYNGRYYLDMSLAFGAANGTAIFQRISDVVRRILANENIQVWTSTISSRVCRPAWLTLAFVGL